MARPALSFVFPGQGSQRVGMGAKIYRKSSEARKAINQADDILGFKLSEIFLRGPAEELAKTAVCQVAIFTVSIAFLRALRKEQNLPEPIFVAGHSLGECTAMVAANSLSFEQALRLVWRRGQLMEEACEKSSGGMAAIFGLTRANLEEICCSVGANVANINSPDQIVISGGREELASAISLAGLGGARKIVRLNVSGPFHSRHMESVAEGMRSAVAEVSFADAKIPLVANTTAKPLTRAEDLQNELVDQICRPVLWTDTIRYIVDNRATGFVEIGSGRVLSGLIKKINPEANIVAPVKA